jgi:hypothetical protein
VGDTHASVGMPDEEGRIKDTQDSLSGKLAHATTG